MTFADLENAAIEQDAPDRASDTLSIAWANVSPLIPEREVDAAAMRSLRELLANDDADVDSPTRQWFTRHGVTVTPTLH